MALRPEPLLPRELPGHRLRRQREALRLLERVGFQYDLRREVVFRGEPCVELVSFIAFMWAGGTFGKIFGIQPPDTGRLPGG